MVILYAFVGFEVLAVPAGEMQNPRRAVPFAMVSVLSLTTVVYLGVMAVSFGTFDGIASAKNPVADASATFLGPGGATLIAAAIAVSIFGTNAGSALITPRCVFALAEKKQLPAALARVHPRFGTPYVAIWVSAALSAALALSGTLGRSANA